MISNSLDSNLADCFSLSAGVLRGGCRGLPCALASRQPDHHTTCQPHILRSVYHTVSLHLLAWSGRAHANWRALDSWQAFLLSCQL